MMRTPWSVPIVVGLALAGCGGNGHGTGRGGAGGGIDASGLGGIGGGGLGGAGGAGGGGTGGTGGSPPDGIVVTTPSGRMASDSVDGYCDILEAVAAASTGRTVRECANPNASTRIILTGGASYPTAKTLRFATATDKPIRIGIADGTTGSATISAAAGWLLDPGDPPTTCLVHASAGAAVELDDVTLTQAPSLTVSGACLTRGSLTVERGRLTGFHRGGASVTCLPATGCDNGADAAATATLLIRNSLVDANTTAGDGGGATSAGFGALLIVEHSSVVGNTAAGTGGGLYFGGGWNTHVIRASTISGNRAGAGGGVMVKFACSNTYLNVINSTIANNTADGTGGGVQFEPADHACATQDLVVFSSIIAGNHSLSSLESNVNAGWWTTDANGNLGIFTCYGGSLIYVAPGYPRPTEPDVPCLLATRDPHLGPLVSMGGTGSLPVHPLLAGSPAIDASTDDMLDDQRDQWIPLLDPPLQPPADEWQLYDRLVDGDGDGTKAADLGAVEMNARWQTELLAVAAKGPSPHKVVLAPAGFDRGAGTTYAATSATNEFVTYRLPIAEPGYYDFTVGVLATPAGGKLQISVADDPGGPWTDVGTTQDTFAQSDTFATLGPLAGPLFPTAGERLVRFTVVGQNSTSGGYGLTFDYIDARRSTKPCAVAQIASGTRHSCALTAAGGVRCWGTNDAGQLGDGSTTAAGRVPARDALAGAKAIATGDGHTCALTTAGGVRCWGANDAGQLGDGSTTGRTTPPGTDVLTGVAAIATGARHTCALTTAGGVRCWGANDAGQLGDGSTMGRTTPPSTDALTGVKAIAAGGSVTCALMSAGGVRCWGANGFGQLGDGSTDDRATPPSTDIISNIAAISVATGHTCALTTTGGVRCWGHNANGELGDGSYSDALSPPGADVLAGAVAVAAAANFTCAVTATGGERCWGANDIGQLGDDTLISVDRMTPATMDNLGGVRAVALGLAYTCALMTGGGVRCWGANDAGQLGDGLGPDYSSSPPAQDISGFTGTCP